MAEREREVGLILVLTQALFEEAVVCVHVQGLFFPFFFFFFFLDAPLPSHSRYCFLKAAVHKTS